jgi:predicted MFS family arabinose efflux permease
MAGAVSSESPLKPAIAGLCGLLVGVGLARFAYTPLLPALISGQWFSASAAGYLGAANLAGYLAGAVLGHAMTRIVDVQWLLRVMMALTAASLFACERREFGFLWFFAWRLVAGYTGGVIMVVAAPAVLSVVSAERRGIVGGIMFAGVGLGIATSGTLVPTLVAFGGLEGAWLGLGGLGLVLTVLTWSKWPHTRTVSAAPAGLLPARLQRPVIVLMLEYGLNAAGLVPHMLFLVDYVARGLGRGLATGGSYWVLFGLGAMIGPLMAGQLADRIGFRAAMRIALVLQATAIGLLVVTSGTIMVAVSSLVAGAFTPGISSLMLGRVYELVESVLHRQVWAYATIAWALAQAAGSYGFAYLYSRSNDFPLLFGLGALALVIALAADLIGTRGGVSRAGIGTYSSRH